MAVVTGGNKGIGYETTLHLAIRKAKVYLATRSQTNASTAIEEIKAHDPSIHVEFLPLDLANLKSVREAADQILQTEKTIDILVCNAGVVAQEMSLTEDGIEIDFQTNYLGLYGSRKVADNRTLLLHSFVIRSRKPIGGRTNCYGLLKQPQNICAERHDV